jgi:glycosyltransferase involved in cell wall biosynthesis
MMFRLEDDGARQCKRSEAIQRREIVCQPDIAPAAAWTPAGSRSAMPDPMIPSITPVILTKNEDANLARTLEGVAWARDIVLVDSFSNDQTLAIAARFANVRVFQRRFDSHANQWNFAIEQTNISSDWILALDADYVAPPGAQTELARATREAGRAGFLADFRYCVFGRPLRASLYPEHVVLFRRGRGRYAQFGHTQRLVIDGEIGRLAVKLDHDDRKPLGRWLEAQAKYAGLEAEFVAQGRGELRAIDRLRKTGWLAPIVVLLHVLLVKHCLLEGWRGWYYALQRTLFEILFCLAWLEREQMQAPAARAVLPPPLWASVRTHLFLDFFCLRKGLRDWNRM